jgi:hypothetical protein
MENVLWIKASDAAKSWHVLDEVNSIDEMKVTLCGRETFETPVDDRPGNEKTCEICLRIQVDD